MALLFCIGTAMPIFRAAADTSPQIGPNWLSSETPVVSKIADLPDNVEPFSMGMDCTPADFPTGLHNDGSLAHGCEFGNALGNVTNSYLINGKSGTLLFDDFYSGFFLPSPPGSSGNLVTFTYPRSWSSGAAIRFSNYDGKPAQYVTYFGVPPIERYVYSPVSPVTLKDGSNATIPFREDTLAYSSNGTWMAILTDSQGVMLYNTKTLSGKLIAWDKNSVYSRGETQSVNLAVSDDGKFVAVNSANSSGAATLRVYDTDTCKDQYTNDPSTANNCEYKDIWNGTYRGKTAGAALKNIVNVEYPRHLRFTSNDTLQFDGVHDRTGSKSFKVSRYTASVSNPEHDQYVSLLGMGDSYIAGEGAFQYMPGTDTSNNKCHNSWLSYPIATGKQYFPQVRSVACSGAKINDIDAGLLLNGDAIDKARNKYAGQVLDQKTWDKRTSEQNSILNGFIPGYANQVKFTDKFKPRVTLLSIGGNDVHFADIVTQCVSPTSSDTCYASYEDRRELMQNIVSQYDKLVALYKDVAASSGGDVYVIGYPQIAKPNGSCGKNVMMSSDEVQFSADLIAYIDSIISKAAASAGVYYIDTQSALNGYRLCEAPKGKAALNGFTKGNDGGITVKGKQINFVGKESYHPTVFGYSLLGKAIASKTRNFTASMPAANSKPAPNIDNNDPLLQHAPKTNRAQNTIIWHDSDYTKPLAPGGSYTFKTNDTSLQNGSHYQLVLHSTPTTLSEGIKTGQDVTVTIPSNTAAGFHTLDIYGTDSNGQLIDERQVIYVATVDDLTQGKCLGMPLSGIDDNGNGVDDTCDMGYFDPSLVPYFNDPAPDYPAPLDEGNPINSDDSGNLLHEAILTSSNSVTQGSDKTEGGSEVASNLEVSPAGDTPAISIVSSEAANIIASSTEISTDPHHVLGVQKINLSHGDGIRKNSPTNSALARSIIVLVTLITVISAILLLRRSKTS